jgi:hypothetical protein
VSGNRSCGVLQRWTGGESAINGAQPINLALALLASPNVLFDKSELLAVQGPIGVKRKKHVRRGVLGSVE